MSTFGKKKLIRDISANTLQMLITQVFGLIIFYFTSKYLQKSDFGEFNWCMAVGSTIIAISSLGLDLIFVRRVAAGEDVLVISGIHFFHTVLTGVVLSAAALVIRQFVPAFTDQHPFFFFVFVNLALANMANSFKLCLNGLEAYRRLALIALYANVAKLALIILLYLGGHFSILTMVLAYTAVSLLELGTGYFMMNRQLSVRIKPSMKVIEYKYFILESLPQLGVVLFDSALARIDWILLGVISTATVTAEYSFAYKVFELSKLPLMIIAPVLLTRFSKLFSADDQLSERYRRDIHFFFKLELFIIVLVPLLLSCCWSPLVDYFTGNKYGAVNQNSFTILAACVPLSGLINFLWTVGFVQGQLKTIMWITISASVANILANLVMIPVYGGTGAALAYLFSTLLQAILYLCFTGQEQVRIDLRSCGITLVNAVVAAVAGRLSSNNVIFATALTLCVFVALSFITGIVSVKQLKQTLMQNRNNGIN